MVVHIKGVQDFFQEKNPSFHRVFYTLWHQCFQCMVEFRWFQRFWVFYPQYLDQIIFPLISMFQVNLSITN